MDCGFVFLFKHLIKGNIVNAIPTDTTLSHDGQVADAKAVGDAVAEKAQVQIVTWGADD